jgi:hypothetical protein
MGTLTNGLNTPPIGTVVRSLLIVARDQLEVYSVLQHAFGASEDIAVILDRRREDRRRRGLTVAADRRRTERRGVPRVEEDVRLRHYVLVRPYFRRPHD